MSLLTFDVAKTNIVQSIAEYRAKHAPFLPNDDARDAAVLDALARATTWQQLGVLAPLRSNRLGLLQKPIAPLPADYTKAIAMRFDEGNIGWYWWYGMSVDGLNGVLVGIFRMPTKGAATAADSMYTVFGYVLDAGATLPFNTLTDGPIVCPGTFTWAADVLSLTMDLSVCGPSVNITKLQFGGTSGLKNMTTTVTFKDGKTYIAQQVSAVPGLFRGEKGCVPTCAAGVGTDYWSFTFTKGTGTGFGGGGGVSTPIIGWFDHQWMNVTPHTVGLQALMTTVSEMKVPGIMSWIWATMQISSRLQYSIQKLFTTVAEVNGIRVGKTYKAVATRMLDNHPTYNVPCTITIVNMFKEDARLVAVLRVTVDRKRFLLNAVGDGRVVLFDGSVNLETLAMLYDDDTHIQIGVGLIECNMLHDKLADTTRMLQLAGVRADPSVFMPHKVSLKQAEASIAFLTGMGLLGVVVLVVLILGAVKLAGRRH
jgi:hypothetical protein